MGINYGALRSQLKEQFPHFKRNDVRQACAYITQAIDSFGLPVVAVAVRNTGFQDGARGPYRYFDVTVAGVGVQVKITLASDAPPR